MSNTEDMEGAFVIIEAAGMGIPYGCKREDMIKYWTSECQFAPTEIVLWAAREWARHEEKFPVLVQFLERVKAIDYQAVPHRVGYSYDNGTELEKWQVLDLATGTMHEYTPTEEDRARPELERPLTRAEIAEREYPW